MGIGVGNEYQKDGDIKRFYRAQHCFKLDGEPFLSLDGFADSRSENRTRQCGFFSNISFGWISSRADSICLTSHGDRRVQRDRRHGGFADKLGWSCDESDICQACPDSRGGAVKLNRVKCFRRGRS